MFRSATLALVLSFGLVQSASSATYKLDPSHTNILFKIKHLVVATVTGRFDTFEGSFDFDEKTGQMANLDVKINAKSINTNEPDRDKHLRSADFFNTEKYPEILFTSAKSTTKNQKPVALSGEITLVGQKKPLTFQMDHKGAIRDPWGNERIIFEATTTINRKDFGINWNKKLDKGGFMIGDEVKVIVEAEAIKQDSSAKQ